MKKFLFSIPVILIFFSCKKDYLNRFPITEVSPQTFFKTEKDLMLYTNSFYAYLPGINIVTSDLTSDNIEDGVINKTVAGERVVPVTASSAGWTFTGLRNYNFFLANYERAQISETIKAKYAGIARFFRAWYYFDMMKRFGNVPWYSKPLETTDPDLYKPRDSRVLVTDSIIADLDFAINSLDATKNSSTVTKWTALALKSRVCLYEGTFRKYHTELNLSGANDLLQKAVDASLELMQSGQYSIYKTSNPRVDYLNLFTTTAPNAEVILATNYSTTLVRTHNANGIFLVATQGGRGGLTKDFIDSYLMLDGSFFSQVPGSDTFNFYKETQSRDYRLAETTRTPGYTRMGSSTKLIPDFTKSPTGYNIIKFVTGPEYDVNNTNINALPVFRYAEVLLNFAEAKAELHTLTQNDLAISINLTRARGGLPPMDINNVQADPTLQSLYPGVSDALILEIRRERRIELVMEGFRWDDLMRWKSGNLLAKRFQGMYFNGKGTFDLDGDGNIDFAVVDVIPPPASQLPNVQYLGLNSNDTKLSEDDKGNLIVHPNEVKTFDEDRDYLFPLPLNELSLNPKLVQNPNW